MARSAVIDIGTNSVKLLIAEVTSSGEVIPEYETSVQTRLGRGFYVRQELQEEPVRLTAAAVANFAEEAREAGAQRIVVLATSAAREARNQEAFCRQVEAASGLPVRILSGQQEAEWVFLGMAGTPGCRGHRTLILDVGGGSTEFLLGRDHHLEFQASFPLGTVRSLESGPSLGENPGLEGKARAEEQVMGYLQTEVQPQLGSCLKGAGGELPLLLATGGTPAILARVFHRTESYDRDLIEETVLSDVELEQLSTMLWTTPLTQRRKLPGMPPERADVILLGAVIFTQTQKLWGLKHLRVSLRGLRFGALMAGK